MRVDGGMAHYRYGIATPSALRAEFQAVTPIDLAPFWARRRNTAES